MWLCGLHNQVNVRLGKDEFDCSAVSRVILAGIAEKLTRADACVLQLEGLYDCGCGDEGKAASCKSACMRSDGATFQLMP